MHSLEVKEHQMLANGDFIEQINRILRTIHKHVRKFPLVFHSDMFKLEREEEIDPDQFILTSTLSQDHTGKLVSLFAKYPILALDIMNDLEFGLELKKSSIPNPRLTSSVFLRLKGTKPLPAGSLVGFVPGVYREQDPRDANLDFKTMFRPNGKLFHVDEKIPHPNDRLECLSKLAKGETVDQSSHQRFRIRTIHRPRRKPQFFCPGPSDPPSHTLPKAKRSFR